jgi:hypothetical protein
MGTVTGLRHPTHKAHRVFQKELYNIKGIYKFRNSEDIYSVLNSHNAAKHTEF